MEQVGKRKGAAAVIVIPLMAACVEFSNIARNPRFEQIRTVDIIGLMGVGFCIGVAFAAVMFLIRGNRIG